MTNSISNNKYSPEIEKQLEALAELVCDSIEGASEEFTERRSAILESLLQSGFSRVGKGPLWVELELRIARLCREPAMHRLASVKGLLQQLQKEFDDLARWKSNTPSTKEPPRAANVDSAGSSTSRRHAH